MTGQEWAAGAAIPDRPAVPPPAPTATPEHGPADGLSWRQEIRARAVHAAAVSAHYRLKEGEFVSVEEMGRYLVGVASFLEPYVTDGSRV